MRQAAAPSEAEAQTAETAQSADVTAAERTAILAALNLADELSRNRKHWEGERGEIEARVTELVDRLGGALERA